MIMIYTIIPAVTNLVSIIPILFYKLSGKKMAEIQARLEIKRAKDAAKLDENGNPIAAQNVVEEGTIVEDEAVKIEDAGLAVQIEQATNDESTAAESQIMAEATQNLINDEEASSEEETKKD